MDPIHGWAREATFLLWLDSDLIILDFNMRIEMIAEQYPQSDMILSKDMPKAAFVANSGFILLRNTDWARTFMERWWSSYDRRKCCDQNAFTWLYDQMADTEKGKIAILPPDAVNSDFPSWMHQKEYNQVLHLAGTTNLLRQPVFKEAFTSICETLKHQGYNSGNENPPSFLSHLPSQLGKYQLENITQLKNGSHIAIVPQV